MFLQIIIQTTSAPSVGLFVYYVGLFMCLIFIESFSIIIPMHAIKELISLSVLIHKILLLIVNTQTTLMLLLIAY